MKADQVDVPAAAVSCDSQQIIHAFEPRFTGEIVRDVGERHRGDRVDDDMAFVHLIAATDLDVRTGPDANAASDSAAADPIAKSFGELHARDNLLSATKVDGNGSTHKVDGSTCNPRPR
jgi:hypothetical protein